MSSVEEGIQMDPSDVLPPMELTVKEAAAVLDCHPKTVRRYIKQGKVHWTQVHGKYGPEYRISRQSIEHLSTGVVSPGQAAIESAPSTALLGAIQELTIRLAALESSIQRLLPPAQGELNAQQELLQRIEGLEVEVQSERKARQALESSIEAEHQALAEAELTPRQPWWRLWRRGGGGA